MDFSINVLTLLGIVLSIGLVVDDAIVVLENIYTRIEKGENPLKAAEKGSEEIFFCCHRNHRCLGGGISSRNFPNRNHRKTLPGVRHCSGRRCDYFFLCCIDDDSDVECQIAQASRKAKRFLQFHRAIFLFG